MFFSFLLFERERTLSLMSREVERTFRFGWGRMEENCVLKIQLKSFKNIKLSDSEENSDMCVTITYLCSNHLCLKLLYFSLGSVLL